MQKLSEKISYFDEGKVPALPKLQKRGGQIRARAACFALSIAVSHDYFENFSALVVDICAKLRYNSRRLVKTNLKIQQIAAVFLLKARRALRTASSCL